MQKCMDNDGRKMITCAKCQNEKLPEFFSVRLAKKNGRSSWCKDCHNKSASKWNAENYAVYMANLQEYRITHAERRHATNAEYRRTHPDNGRAAKWSRDNPEKEAAKSARRRSQKLRATPAWGNQFFMDEAYDLARRRTLATGFEWHVDHLVPLKSALVCGLHVEHNLQIIPGAENISKKNRHWPDMWIKQE